VQIWIIFKYQNNELNLCNQSKLVMYNINLQHLKVINAIEKNNSMTKAAEVLNLSQSALSHHLKELENNIGQKVFDRRNKKLWITEAGRKLLNASELILNELMKLEVQLKSLKSGSEGVIRISTECYTTYNWLPKLIRDFNRQFPKAEVKIVTEATRKPLEYLMDGQIDIAIASRKKNHTPSLKYVSILKDELVVILHKEHLLASKKVIKANDLQNQSIFVYDSDDKDIGLIQQVLKPNNISPAQIIKLQLTEIIIEMIKSNLGIAIMSKWLTSPLISKELIVIPFKDSYAIKNWQMVSHSSQSELQKKFIEFAVNSFRTQ
jgi:LysR family transcriptional regulator, regulator for metE and metH